TPDIDGCFTSYGAQAGSSSKFGSRHRGRCPGVSQLCRVQRDYCRMDGIVSWPRCISPTFTSELSHGSIICCCSCHCCFRAAALLAFGTHRGSHAHAIPHTSSEKGQSIMKFQTNLRCTPALAFALAGALAMTGCVASADAGNAENIETADLTSVTLMLNWTPNAHHAGIYYALEHGLYEEAGIELEILEPGADIGAEAAVAEGQATFGISQAESLL